MQQFTLFAHASQKLSLWLATAMVISFSSKEYAALQKKMDNPAITWA